MEGDNNTTKEQEKSPNGSMAFHSNGLMGTKAREKREVFTNVKEKNSFKQHAIEIGKKITNAKQNPETNIAQKRIARIDKQTTKKLIILIVIAASLVAAGYYLYPIIKKYFAINEEKAIMLAETNPEKSIKMFEKLIQETDDNEQKAILHIRRSSALREIDSDKYLEQIMTDAYEAENLYPTITTAEYIAEIEHEYGSETKAKEYEEKASERERYLIMGEG